MRRRSVLTLILAFLLLSGSGVGAIYIKSKFFTTASASDTNTAVSFGFSGYGLIINDGPSAVHVNLSSTTATASDFKLKVGEKIETPAPITGIGLICAAGETSSVRVLATEIGS